MRQRPSATYLGCPPPFSSVHIKVDTNFARLIGVVLFRDEEKQGHKLWISIERPDALQNVSEIDLEGLAGDDDLVPLELRSHGRKLLVDDGIEFARVLETQLECFGDLGVRQHMSPTTGRVRTLQT